MGKLKDVNIAIGSVSAYLCEKEVWVSKNNFRILWYTEMGLRMFKRIVMEFILRTSNDLGDIGVCIQGCSVSKFFDLLAA